MRNGKPENLVIYYIYLAIGCGILGVIITFLLIFACGYYGIDISKNLWVVAIPVTLSVFLNVCFVELFRKYRNK